MNNQHEQIRMINYEHPCVGAAFRYRFLPQPIHRTILKQLG